jgi:hypothetical protein
MQTRREYLIGLGLAKEGRGKLSNAAHEAIKAALEAGTEFSDLQDRPVVVKREKKPREDSQPEGDNRFADARVRYESDKMFSGTDSKGKTHKVYARQGCYDSPYSIAGCFTCGETHRALVSTGGSMEWITVSPIGG